VRLASILTMLAVACLGIGAARAERLTVAVSSPEVQITSNFTGVAVTTFGVIEGADPANEAGYQIAVAVIGPAQSVVERRKDRILGIWANRAAETIIGAPSFYALSTSAPLETIAPKATLARLGLGFDNLGLVFANGGNSGATQAEFQQAFIRLQSQDGLFTQGGTIELIASDVFRTTTFLPANIPEGRYSVLAYLFSGQTLLAAGQANFNVSKIGVEQTVASFATGQSLIYGLLTVALSVFVGWLGGVIFRRD
jgi:uncharacterized protein (TIGR02186 family)